MHVSARERLLEGFLLRLARAADADAFALRGGMLVRSWVPDAKRSIRDVDLVCSLPLASIGARLRELLADRSVGDDVGFDAERFRIDRWPGGSGVTLFAAGDAGGEPAEMMADLWFGLDVWPAATRGVVVTARGPIPMWLCPHELVIATKLGVLAELGPRHWRAKDLADIWIALRRFPPRIGVLGEAIERSCKAGWQQLLSAAWWREPRAQLRWARESERPLDAVVAEVRQALAPLARRS
ncbi:MAG: nucleotidyl transferase AbiEii/AbiGii toxin family protein [Kofleriaceae bacterium]